MSFAWFVALRFLWDQRAQSALIVSGVGVGVGVIVFLSALIGGLQQDLIRKTLGTQAHVVVSPPEEHARALLPAASAGELLRRSDKPQQRVRSIDQWQVADRAIARLPGVVATAPLSAGAAFAIRGNATETITVFGIEPERFERVIPMRSALIAGHFATDGSGALIGSGLADKLGLRVGDKLRVQTAEEHSELFIVRGIFDLGNRQVNERWVLLSQRNAQTLLGLVGGASAIYVRVEDIYSASELATAITAATGLDAESWMQTNAQLLTALRSQSASSSLIRVFVTLAVAIGISSVLAVSVVQRSREIGILRAMGASTGGVLRAFLLQGGLLGLSGSLIGCVLGGALAVAFPRFAAGADGVPLFPVLLTPSLFLSSTCIAFATGIAAALFPARRAARLDPAVAIAHV